jgi:hypothetical protein
VEPLNSVLDYAGKSGYAQLMTTENKVVMWKMAYEALPLQNAKARRDCIEAISELEEEIEKRFEEHLPMVRKERGNAVIGEAKDYTEKRFKNPDDPQDGYLEVFGKLLASACHIPKGE